MNFEERILMQKKAILPSILTTVSQFIFLTVQYKVIKLCISVIILKVTFYSINKNIYFIIILGEKQLLLENLKMKVASPMMFDFVTKKIRRLFIL